MNRYERLVATGLNIGKLPPESCPLINGIIADIENLAVSEEGNVEEILHAVESVRAVNAQLRELYYEVFDHLVTYHRKIEDYGDLEDRYEQLKEKCAQLQLDLDKAESNVSRLEWELEQALKEFSCPN
jgi:chromosome segregation ATPase